MDGARAEIGIIGGTGLYDMPGLSDVRDLALETPFGLPSTPIRLGTLANRRVAFLARHGRQHGLLPTEVPYRANVYAMRLLGVRHVFAVGAVGSLREDLAPRTAVVPDQAIDLTRRRPLSFFGDGVVAHVGFGEPFDEAMRQAWIAGARAAGVPVVERGTYVTMEGPQFSTRAESRMYRTLGGDVVGMTNGIEARLAREAEIAYATLAMVTDYDAWHPGHDTVDVASVVRVLEQNQSRVRALLSRLIRDFPVQRDPCPYADHALDGSVMTIVEARDPVLMAKLDAVAGRILRQPGEIG